VNILPRVLEEASTFRERPSDAEMERLAEEKEMEPLFT